MVSNLSAGKKMLEEQRSVSSSVEYLTEGARPVSVLSLNENRNKLRIKDR